MSKRPLVYWNILGEGARKASNANIDTSPKITINFLEEVGALHEVVGDAVVSRFSVVRKRRGCATLVLKRSRAWAVHMRR